MNKKGLLFPPFLSSFLCLKNVAFCLHKERFLCLKSMKTFNEACTLNECKKWYNFKCKFFKFLALKNQVL